MSSAQPIQHPEIIIFAPEADPKLRKGKQALVNYYRAGHGGAVSIAGYDEGVIRSELSNAITTPLRKGRPVHVLMHAHGLVVKESEEQKIFTDKPGAGQPKNAADVAKLLIEWGLVDQVKELHLVACFSDKFAKALAIELGQKGFKNLIIKGYEGEVNVSYGKNGGIIAGMDRDRDPSAYRKNQDGEWEVDLVKIGNSEELKERYAGGKHCKSHSVQLGSQSQALGTPQLAAVAPTAQHRQYFPPKYTCSKC
jgi:hypothetical protein